MTSPFVEPLPKRKRRKGPDEEITKNVVVLRSNQVCEMDGVVLMPKTTLDMSGIKKLGQSKKVTFTKSTSSRDMQRKLEEKFPFLEEASERYLYFDWNTCVLWNLMKHSQASRALVFWISMLGVENHGIFWDVKFNSERGRTMQGFHQCDVRGSGEALPCAFAQFALLPY